MHDLSPHRSWKGARQRDQQVQETPLFLKGLFSEMFPFCYMTGNQARIAPTNGKMCLVSVLVVVTLTSHTLTSFCQFSFVTSFHLLGVSFLAWEPAVM